MFEHRSEPLISRADFAKRLAKHGFISLAVIFCSLAIGIISYHLLEGFSWIDSLVNASMILGGMGPVSELHTTGGKIFASAYALFSGVVFLVMIGIFLAPILHRFLHKFHLESEEEE